MPLITTKSTTFINKENKYRMMVEFRQIFEEMIPSEKGELVMADFYDEVFILFGDNASDPAAILEVAMIKEAYDRCGHRLLEAVLNRLTEVVIKYTQVPEERIFAFYRNAPLWCYNKKDVLPELMQWGLRH